MAAAAPKSRTLLVIECDPLQNWYKVFEDVRFQGAPLVVDQCEFEDLTLNVYEKGQLVVTIRRAKRPIANSPQTGTRTITPDFILLRSVTRFLHGQDCRNLLYGFMTAGIKSVNSLESAYFCLERPIVYGMLRQLKKKLGEQAFPLVEQYFYPGHRTMLISPSMPIVCKIGHAHAGYGKVKFTEQNQFEDFRGCIALHEDYVTAEPYIKWDYDLRVQKIGDHYRAFKRVSTNWKGNVGNSSVISEVPVTVDYKRWVDEASQVMGGLDICAIDALHSETDGKYHILELNDTAIGLVHACEEEDRKHIRELVLLRMHQTFGSSAASPTTSAFSTNPAPTSPEQELTRLRMEVDRVTAANVVLERNLATHQNAPRGNDGAITVDQRNILLGVIVALLAALIVAWMR